MRDSVVPFVFDALPVRGALVQLEKSWQKIAATHVYADSIAKILGDSAAATALIAQSLKFEGTVTLQMTGDGPLSMLVIQATHELDLRGMASANETDGTESFADLIGNARCAVTVDAGSMDRPYQGIVEMTPESLARSLENYFARSVQVPSHLQLRSSPHVCGGILLQQMPGREPADEDDWRRLAMLIETLRVDELNGGTSNTLLHKLFAEDDLRVFDRQPLRFRCRCSQIRVEEALRLLGEEEARVACEEQGGLTVTCEYCGQVRAFDAVDIGRIFQAHVQPPSDLLQ